LWEKRLCVLAQKPLKERKCHARLTREYTDGGANICAESTQFSSAKNLFFADENEIRFIWAVIRSAVLYSA
jgi:hypothetical protein